MGNQNFSLEIINGAVTIDTFFFLIWGLYHLYGEFHRRKLTWYFALVMLPSVALVVAMTGERFGTLLTRLVIWIWRMRGARNYFTDIENFFLFSGAAITAACLLWSIAILTRLKLGEWPWRIAAGTTLLYIVFASFMHYVL